ncbi:kinase-like domain-containing protein [Hypoxylon sp. NC1633]|nr:kinase-like domain-containing protein [Hypoxylon sp. NC1633]
MSTRPRRNTRSTRSTRSSGNSSIRDQAAVIQTYFQRDAEQRFVLEGLHGRGGQGSIYKVKVLRSEIQRTPPRMLVVKIADPHRGSDVEGLMKERSILQSMKGCRHIVHIRNGPNDPLAPAAEELGWAWIYLDELENGTLASFMERAKNAGFLHLPNRVMWRIFMCMVRACIAMAWPGNDPNNNETATSRPNTKPSGLVHNDIHGGNLMFGPFMEHPEHSRTPILKLLDFGLSQMNSAWPAPTVKQTSLLTHKQMMATMIRLQTDSKYTGEEIQVNLTRIRRQEQILSPASGILEDEELGYPDPCPTVDHDLRLLVAACMASEPNDRPSLAELEKWVVHFARNRSHGFYAYMPDGGASESDDQISRVMQHCLYNA